MKTPHGLVLIAGVCLLTGGVWYGWFSPTLPRYLAPPSRQLAQRIEQIEQTAGAPGLMRALTVVGRQPDAATDPSAQAVVRALTTDHYQQIHGDINALLATTEPPLSDQEKKFWHAALAWLDGFQPVTPERVGGSWSAAADACPNELINVFIQTEGDTVSAQSQNGSACVAATTLFWQAPVWTGAPGVKDIAVQTAAGTPATLALNDADTLQGAGFTLRRLFHYHADFAQPQAGGEWSHPQISTTPSGRRFLGPFTAEPVTLSWESLPAHEFISLSFELFTMLTWDGNDLRWGPDVWELRVADGSTLLHTTFSTGIYPQAYPDSHPGGEHPSYTGAAEQHTLGYRLPGPRDAVYRFNFAFPHTTPSLKLVFAGIGLQHKQDENWGLANVTVQTHFTAPKVTQNP